MESSVADQISQLENARKLVLTDAVHYPQVVQGILPIGAPGARVELRRWVSEFLAETFASPSVAPQQKETMGLIVLETLKTMLENPQEDSAVVKNVVQTAASIYPLVFRWMYVASLPDIYMHLEFYLPYTQHLLLHIWLFWTAIYLAIEALEWDLTCMREQYQQLL